MYTEGEGCVHKASASFVLNDFRVAALVLDMYRDIVRVYAIYLELNLAFPFNLRADKNGSLLSSFSYVKKEFKIKRVT